METNKNLAERLEAAKERALKFNIIEQLVNDLYEDGHNEVGEDLAHFALFSTLADPSLSQLQIIFAYCKLNRIEIRIGGRMQDRCDEETIQRFNYALAERN